MHKIIGILLAAVVIAYFAVYLAFLDIPAFKVVNELVIEKEIENPYYKEKEEAVLGFIREHMIGINGEILSNIRPSREGFLSFSESAGLLLDYSARRGNKGLFEQEFSYLKKQLLAGQRYVKWVDAERAANCNAVIDDLRIIKALLDGYDRWKEPAYLEMAKSIQTGLIEKQVEDGCLYELYDWKQNKTKKAIPLCYLDFSTLYRLQSLDGRWTAVTGKGLETVTKGRIEKTPLFFKKYYQYDSGKYSVDEEYAKIKGICLTYTLYTALHLAEIKRDTGALTEWLKQELEKGKLYAWYNPETLQPARKIESTAVYALAAVYAKKSGEEELYKGLVDKMLEFMVKDDHSVFYGGFGTEITLDFYSFDNLTALWALSLANK